jgi:transcriptional regulator with XRE-family HTH domain
MAKKFRDLVAHMPKERRARIAVETQRLIDEMPLQELRKALELTQQQVAASLSVNQVAVSKMENQTDMYVSTLRRFVEAMGGELHIVAHFPQGDVEISQFKQVQALEPTESATA